MKQIKKVLDTGDSLVQHSKVKNARTMNLRTMSDDDIIDLFTLSFEDRIAKYNNIESFDVVVKRATGESGATVEVTVFGTAGSPTLDQWKNRSVENSESLTISRGDKGEATFFLIPEDTVYLNTTEYIVTYRA
jgi:hypothetical protein